MVTVVCYQIPMNLDYIGTDEFGNIVPTDDPKKVFQQELVFVLELVCKKP